MGAKHHLPGGASRRGGGISEAGVSGPAISRLRHTALLRSALLGKMNRTHHERMQGFWQGAALPRPEEFIT